MKKKLEAELISIAHRILKLKNKSEVIQLHQETQKLYEILSVLRFYEENFEEAKPTIGLPELEEKLEETFENKEPETVAVVEEPKKEEPIVAEKEPEVIAAPEETLEEVITEASVSEEENTTLEEVVAEPEQEAEPEVVEAESEKVVVGQIDIDESDLEEEEPLIEEEKAAFPEVIEEPVFEPVKEEPRKEAQQITLEDLLGQHTYKEPEFVKVEDVPAEVEKVAEITFEPVFEPVIESKTEVPSFSIDAEKDAYSRKTDTIGKSISLGLNDRIAFEKNLFGGSGEDLNRVLSQLNSFDNYQDAHNFIEDLVKPDYNNWEGKEEYETRFMEIVERRFS